MKKQNIEVPVEDKSEFGVRYDIIGVWAIDVSVTTTIWQLLSVMTQLIVERGCQPKKSSITNMPEEQEFILPDLSKKKYAMSLFIRMVVPHTTETS